MRRALPALVLAFAACSSDPTPPADAGPADAGATTDLGAPDAGQPDAGAVDAGPADTGTDQGPTVDVGQPDTGPGVDAGEDASLPPGDDGSALDAGHDTGVDVPRVGLDTGPRDTGPVDAQGVQSYPLDPPPGETEVRVLHQRTCPETDGGPCDGLRPIDTATMASCSRMGNRLSFTLRACQGTTCFSVTGAFSDYRTSMGGSVSIFSGVANQGRNLTVRSGSEARVDGVLRQSFHVQFDAPASASVTGITGVPGRTVDPTRGDLWLLGCPVQ